SEGARDATATDEIRFLERVDFVEIQFALLGLAEEFGEDGDFDGAGSGESFVGVRCDGVSGREVEDVNAEDAVERFVGFVNGGVEFLEEEAFFGKEWLLGAGSGNK